MQFGAVGRTRAALAGLAIVLAGASCTSAKTPSVESTQEPTPSSVDPARLQEAQQWLATNAPKTPELFRLVGGVNAEGHVLVALRSDQVKLAESLAAAYSGAIDIKVGMFEYPVDKAIAPVCRPVQSPSGDLSDVAAQVSLATSQVSAGADLSGKVVITNTGKFSVQYLASVPLKAVIVRRGTTDVVGNWDGAAQGTDLSISLEPGASKEIDFVGSTASCYPSVGYIVPPGDYDVLLESFELRNTLNRIVGNVTVSPSPITIVAAPS